MDFNKIPIYIVSFNRLSYLKEQIECFERLGLTNIHIIDNASTYLPLIEYLEKTPYKVYRMDDNYGHMVLFKHPEFKDVVENEYFVLTDPDVIPIRECPKGFLQLFYDVLKANSSVYKVGFSLKIDDLPECYALKGNVKAWEARFWKKAKSYKDIIVYDAATDTTFALYRPKKNIVKLDFLKAIRVGFPYEARHLPWYKNLSTPDDEDVFYNNLDNSIGNWNGTLSADELTTKYFSKKINMRVKLFGFLPLLRIREKENKLKVELFNLIPVYCKRLNTKQIKK